MRVDAPRLEDRLGPLEPPYRSRGEAQIGRVLDRYGVPFFYEQPLVVYDRGRYRTWHPDFTLPRHGGLIVEYAGMMDIPDYAQGIEHKKGAYATNDVAAIFVYPEDLARRAWPDRLLERIERAYRGITASMDDLPKPPSTEYPATSSARPRYR